MVNGILGFEGFAINAWLVWMLPFIGAAAIAAVARYGHKIRDYFAVGLSLASAIFASNLITFRCLRWRNTQSNTMDFYTRSRGWSISGSVVDTHD